VEGCGDRDITWALALHGMFIMGVFVLAVVDRLGAQISGHAK
jgi:hypothetical protein